MSSYAYYPGCSLKATATPYEESLLAVSRLLGIELEELGDWNCCGATAYFSVNETMSHAISARNLAQAQVLGKDVVAPCSACFLGLSKTNRYIETFPEVRKRVDSALAAAGLKYDGGVKVRHLVDVYLDDLGIEGIQAKVKKPLKDLKVACYSGCQLVRPCNNFDDPEYPVKLGQLVRALGATEVNFPMAARCCGGAQMMTKEEVALRMCKNILLCAQENAADLIVTTCPLCQMNLDVMQARVNNMFGTNFKIPVIFFTQLMGVAMEVQPLGLEKNVVKAEVLNRFA